MKNVFFIFLISLFFTSIQAQPYFFDENDECSNPAVIGSFGPSCTLTRLSTTIGATFNSSTDLFSCDSSSLKSSVFFSFVAGISEVEFNLLQGENINVTVLENLDSSSCDPDSIELTNNCFLGLNACNEDPYFEAPKPEVLFTNLTPQTSYLMAIWTDETEQTDFEFCLTRAPAYQCGDGICYKLTENADNCPKDCPPTPTIDECVNAKYIGVRDDCYIEATTIKATYNFETDLFSCDDSPLKSTVFFRFFSWFPNLEFKLSEGENINISLFEYLENECSPDSLELIENCLTNLSAKEDNTDDPVALFTNLKSYPDYLQDYILAIWTDEAEQTDFKFCISAAPIVECGDSICYDLLENPDNCPQDCIGTVVEEQSTSFQIYPNPVFDYLFINTNLNAVSNASVRIHSIDGKAVYEEININLFTNIQLSVNHLPEGIYCLQIYGDQIHHSQKFLKIE